MSWTNTYYFIITDSNLQNILLEKQGYLYSLISYESDDDDSSKFIKDLTGIDTHILYFTDLKIDLDNKKEIITFVVIADSTSNKNNNPNFEWCNLNNIPKDIDQKPILDKWLKIKDNKFNTPWFNKDWFEISKKQLQNILINETNYGINKIINVSQFYVSSISCLLKIETNKGFFFCKRVLPEIFKNEPDITKELSNLLPHYLPEIIYNNNDKGFIITKDFGKNILSESKNFNDWLSVIKTFAQLQIEASKYKDFLLEKEMFDRTTQNMPEILEKYLNDDNKIYLNQEDNLTSKERDKLLNNIDNIKRMYEELGSYNIPSTVEHGDLHSGNIAIDKGRIIFYDWSDCAISHPFFSLRSFLWIFFDKEGHLKDKVEEFPDIDQPYEKLLNAYLEKWTAFNSLENLRKAYELSRILANLSFALQYILLTDSMEEHTKFQYKGSIAKGFRRFLQYL